jgi:hypothetical protein
MTKDEELIWRNINSGHSVLISGQAGSGKSHLLDRFVSHCPKGEKGFVCVLGAPTGIAANNIDGETLYRLLGLGLATGNPVHLFRNMKKFPKRYVKTWKFLKETDILVIDEISMVHPDFFTLLNYLFKKARNSTEPFGGVLLIMVGDFTQLGPVSKNIKPTQVQYAFQTEAWKLARISRIHLQRSYRQKEGSSFLNLLNGVRMGVLSDTYKDLLMSRICETPHIVSKDPGDKTYKLEPIDIFPYRNMVEERNNSKMKELKFGGAKVTHFPPYIHIESNDQWEGKRCKIAIKKARELKRDPVKTKALFPVHDLDVCVGAQVMMRCNFYMSFKVFNGSMGIVTGIKRDTVSVLFVVKGAFMKKAIDVSRFQFKNRIGKTLNLIMDQFPLSLAWGTTIHKVQGLTLESARIDARKCFAPGQLYVALSRVRKIEDLALIGFDESSLIINDDAVRFETVLEVEKPSKKTKN